VPSYSDTFSLAGIGIDRRYEADPEAAIRSGDFFDFIRGAGEPKRFEFSPYDGFREFTSGSDVPVNSSLHVEVQLANQAVRLVLKKNGAREREIVGDRLDLENAGAGVYRVEAFLVGHPLLSANVPWILFESDFRGHGPRVSSGARVRGSQRFPRRALPARSGIAALGLLASERAFASQCSDDGVGCANRSIGQSCNRCANQRRNNKQP
jgi:hypothetical protein